MRKAFLHFLQMKIMSKLCSRAWSALSWWQTAQSNHFLQQGERMETWALRTCLLGVLVAGGGVGCGVRLTTWCGVVGGVAVRWVVCSAVEGICYSSKK